MEDSIILQVLLHDKKKADNGFPKKSAYPLHCNYIKGSFLHSLLVWPVGLGTFMTQEPYLEFRNAE